MVKVEDLIAARSVFTTGDIAKICDVNINTVVNWFESGLLKGYQLPSSSARRVPRAEILDFITRKKLPVKVFSARTVGIVLASASRSLLKLFQGAVGSAFGYELHVGSCAFEVGFVCAATEPEVIFIHKGHIDLDVDSFPSDLARHMPLARTKLVLVLDRKQKPPELSKTAFQQAISLPASEEKLLDSVNEAVNLH